MSNKISGQSSLSTFKEYSIQKKWVAISLLVTSVVVFGGLTTLGGLSQFLPHHLFGEVLNTIGHGGAWSTFVGGGVATTLGTISSIALLINRGRLPLHRAIENKTAIDSLLDDTKINQADHNGNRPLHYAAVNGHAVTQLLNVNTIDINVKNHSGHTPLEVAIRAGKKEVVEQLLACPNVDIDVQTGVWAIGNGSDEIVTLLLASEKCKHLIQPCLFEAVREGKVKYVEMILKNYEDPNHLDLQEAFVLTAYCHRGTCKDQYSKILKLLLTKGVNVNAKSSQFSGQTALHQAANFNDIDLVYQLLKMESIDVNCEDDAGKSPLQLSMEWPWLNVAIALIESNKVSEKNLKIAKEKAEKTTRGGTDCGSVIAAINKCTTI